MKAYSDMQSGPNAFVADFVARSIGLPVNSWKSFNTLSFWDERGIKLAIVYNHYVKPDICMHFAARPGALWAHPEIMYHSFAFPFNGLGCTRVTGLTPADKHAAIKVNRHLGFTQEGLMRRADPSGCDVIIFGMLKEECRWLNYTERKAA